MNILDKIQQLLSAPARSLDRYLSPGGQPSGYSVDGNFRRGSYDYPQPVTNVGAPQSIDIMSLVGPGRVFDNYVPWQGSRQGTFNLQGSNQNTPNAPLYLEGLNWSGATPGLTIDDGMAIPLEPSKFRTLPLYTGGQR